MFLTCNFKCCIFITHKIIIISQMSFGIDQILLVLQKVTIVKSKYCNANTASKTL